MKKTFQIFILSLVLLSPIIPFFIDSPTALAQTPTVNSTDVLNKGYTPLAPLTETMIGGKVTLASYLSGLYKISIAIGSVFAVLMIVWGGIQRMTSEGLEGKSAGMDKVNNAIFGLILLVSAYTILYVINPNLVNFKLGLNTEVDPEVARKLGEAYLANRESDFRYTAEMIASIQQAGANYRELIELGKNAETGTIAVSSFARAEGTFLNKVVETNTMRINHSLSNNNAKQAKEDLFHIEKAYNAAADDLYKNSMSSLVSIYGDESEIPEADFVALDKEMDNIALEKATTISELQSSISEKTIQNEFARVGPTSTVSQQVANDIKTTVENEIAVRSNAARIARELLLKNNRVTDADNISNLLRQQNDDARANLTALENRVGTPTVVPDLP